MYILRHLLVQGNTLQMRRKFSLIHISYIICKEKGATILTFDHKKDQGSKWREKTIIYPLSMQYIGRNFTFSLIG